MKDLQEQIENIKWSQEIVIARQINGRKERRDKDKTVERFSEDTNSEQIVENCQPKI